MVRRSLHNFQCNINIYYGENEITTFLLLKRGRERDVKRENNLCTSFRVIKKWQAGDVDESRPSNVCSVIVARFEMVFEEKNIAYIERNAFVVH